MRQVIINSENKTGEKTHEKHKNTNKQTNKQTNKLDYSYLQSPNTINQNTYVKYTNQIYNYIQ